MASEKFGAKGEWWVIAQVGLIAIALVLDYAFSESLPAAGVMRAGVTILGVLCVLVGALLLMGGVFRLGNNLTAVPRPLESGQLVQSGAYAVVRHPIYAGIFFGMLGIALFFSNWVGILCAVALLVFFDRKAAREEIWLTEKYADYPAYRQKVRKLIPMIY